MRTARSLETAKNLLSTNTNGEKPRAQVVCSLIPLSGCIPRSGLRPGPHAARSSPFSPSASARASLATAPRAVVSVMLTSSRSFIKHKAVIAVGTPVTGRPPHRSVRAAFPHTAPTSGV